MSNTTEVPDVVAVLGRPIPAPEDDQVEAWIARVEGRIGRRVGDLANRLTDPDYKATFKGVVVDVVIRKINNPTGMKSERIDDYYYDRGNEKADLWPTDEEWAELLPEGAALGAFSTRPGFVPDWRGLGRWFGW